MCDYGGQTMLLPVFETNMKNTVTYCFQENTKKVTYKPTCVNT